MRYRIGWIAAFIAVAGWAAASFSTVHAADWRAFQTLRPDHPPLDVAVSAKGRWIYVLAESGEVYIYSPRGELKDRLSVGADVDRIEAGLRDDLLYLSSRSSGTVRMIQVEIVHDIATEGAPSLGPADAPVDIVVFTDFQCPYCARAAQMLHQVADAHPETVRIVFKNFPLRSHPQAKPAAAAALAAHRHGRFWAFHDRLFAEHNRLSAEKIRQIAASLGFDADGLVQEAADPEILARIEQDYRDGQDAGVRGTPTIFVNGRLLQDRSMAGFEQAIVRELARQKGSGG